MTWQTPKIEEISCSCEINSYSNGDFVPVHNASGFDREPLPANPALKLKSRSAKTAFPGLC
jgi:coenzyme PQQ precursor peptide PqqA